jgi:RNA polymerase sigma-70 factor (ECF subfamily)
MGQEEFENKVFVLKDKLFRFARRILDDVQDAEDVVQEVMMNLWNKRFEIKNLINIEAYAMRSVKNMSLDKIKHYQVRQNKMAEIMYRSEGIYNEQPDETNELEVLIKRAIDNLPEKQKLVIHLRDIEGYHFDEMQEILNIDEIAIRVNLSRARKRVKEEILKTVSYGI